jgi:DNA-binding IclR family transcriptional regulator
MRPARTGAAPRPPGTVSALKRGIAVLRCFGADVRALGNGEISVLTGIPKPTVTRLAATLVSLGLMRQDTDTEKYSLSSGVLSLGRAFLASLDVRAQARPHMTTLAEEIGGVVHLGARDALDMAIIETSRAPGSVLAVRLGIGSRLPIATSALGRAYLSSLDRLARAQVLEQLRHSSGADWGRLEQGVERALAEAATHGYCASIGDLYPEIHSIAAPIVLPGGERLAINCGGPAASFPEERLRDNVAPRLLAAARAISREVGGSVPEPRSARRADSQKEPAT